MGIESDQLVFDYLSRVGDLAQQRQLPSQQRMNLVASLRDEIARRRAGGGGSDSPASVRRILDRLGTPDAVVSAVASGGLNVPEQRTARAPRTPAMPPLDIPDLPSPRRAEPGVGAAVPEPEWWRVDGGPGGSDDFVPGFRGGVEIPEILEPPRKRDKGEDGDEGEEKAAGPVEQADAPEPERRLGLPRLLPRRKAAAEKVEEQAPAPRKPRNPMLLVAAGLLLVGLAFGSWLTLAGGWLLAYASRRLSRAEAKWAVFGLPGLAVAGGGVWLWGRLDGRWGDPLPAGSQAMGEALTATWPWVVRAAALASALYLVWRSRRA